jgi:transcription elongation GreA/GreB family factor
MNKEELKNKLIELQNASVRNLEEKITTTHSMVDVDESDTIDPEDLSHQSESAESEHIFRNQLTKAKVDLSIIEQTDFSQKVKVEPGAFVRTEQFNFIVSCATTPFDHNGDHIVGISVDSPIYREMQDLKKGDSFSVSGKTYTIKEIH